MRLRVLLLCAIVHLQSNAIAQNSGSPKLVVGIVVDQMRYDYLYRFESKYGKGGFKRLMSEGFNLQNCHYNYMPTYTGPGHASIYTGCTPSVHGIIANDWYDKTAGAMAYCASDKTFATVGAVGTAGQMAPTRLITTTIGDELKIQTVNKSRVFGVALKDRSAIFPAGHAANGAYWFDDASGKWISSTYYYPKGEAEYPQWIKDANAKNKELYLHYLEKEWKTYYDISTYTESYEDNNPYERNFPGETSPVFPHDLKKVKETTQNFGVIKATPFGSTITKDFSKSLIENEKLGMGNTTDMLCISFSSPDYVGHQFGPSSKEMEDTYIRLDKDLEDLLTYLDQKVGKGKYLVFLTADHGAVEVPDYLAQYKIPVDHVDEPKIEAQLDSMVANRFGRLASSDKYVVSYSNQQVFLNHRVLEKTGNYNEVVNFLQEQLMKYSFVSEVYTSEQMKYSTLPMHTGKLIQNGYNHKRSGDLMVNYKPGVIEYGHQGTTHGSPYSYDTHVPLLFFGSGIPKGENKCYTEITQIATTVCDLLKIPFTNGSNGRLIEFK